MDVAQKQKKTLIVIGLILAVLYFGPSVILTTRQFLFSQEIAARRQAQPAPPPKAERSAIAAVAHDTDGVPLPLSTIIGFWQGNTFQATSLCMMHLELRENPQVPGHVMAFPSVACNDLNAVKSGNPAGMLAKLDPTTAILDGGWDKAKLSIVFTVVKSISPDNCPITAFSVTPFGSKGLTAEWQQGACRSGSVLMERTNR